MSSKTVDEHRWRTELASVFRECLRRLNLTEHLRARLRRPADGDVRLVAIGKAAAEMAAAFGSARGVAACSSEPNVRMIGVQYFVGGHPYPNAQSIDAASAALELLSGCDEETQVLFLLSGGGSAVFERPLFPDITLDDLVAFNRVLVTCGANIYEMNVLRKHFSAVKGGRLAAAAAPARQSTYYVSDVPADKPSTVASGPTMPDESTAEECRAIAARLGLEGRLPPSYRSRLAELPETPKPGDAVFRKSRYVAVLSNEDAIAAAMDLATSRGWAAECDTSCDDWPLERAADYLLERLRSMPKRPACIVSGGELSCPVTGGGQGGRNQAFVLYCAQRIAGERIAVLSAGTDGIDGNSPAAGAIADGSTLSRATLNARLSYQQSDSYTYFAAIGDTVMTGPTGNNVRDLRLLLAY